MPDVRMLYLRDGQEYLSSKATRDGLSLVDKRHKEAGVYGSRHLDGFDAVFLLPKKPEVFPSWQALVESPPPPLDVSQCIRTAVFDEFKFWPQPRDPALAPGPVEYHEEIIRWYGTAYRLYGVDRATRKDQAGQEFNWPSIAASAVVIMAMFVAAIMGLSWYFGQ